MEEKRKRRTKKTGGIGRLRPYGSLAPRIFHLLHSAHVRTRVDSSFCIDDGKEEGMSFFVLHVHFEQHDDDDGGGGGDQGYIKTRVETEVARLERVATRARFQKRRAERAAKTEDAGRRLRQIEFVRKTQFRKGKNDSSRSGKKQKQQKERKTLRQKREEEAEEGRSEKRKAGGSKLKICSAALLFSFLARDDSYETRLGTADHVPHLQ